MRSTKAKEKNLSIRMSEEDHELLKIRSQKAGISKSQYLIDRFRSTREVSVPEINQDAIILLRGIVEGLREQSLATSEIQTAIEAVHRIALEGL